jgi:outer membrane biosynthesis protein TonB
MRRARFLIGARHASPDLTECLLLHSSPGLQATHAGAAPVRSPAASYTPPVFDVPSVSSSVGAAHGDNGGGSAGAAGIFDGMVLLCGHEESPPEPPLNRPAAAPTHEPQRSEQPPPLKSAPPAQVPEPTPQLQPQLQPEPEPEPEPGSVAPERTVVRMVVPAGVAAHDVLTVETESGQRISMALPQGAEPGATIQFEVQPRWWERAGGQVAGKLVGAVSAWLSNLFASDPTSDAAAE